MKKVIFIYWAQKFINAPIVVKKCLLSWKLKNPTWKIIELDDGNLSEYINIEKEIPNIQKKNITKTAYSDIVRMFLLAKHGGCWCDATTFCNKPLDNWLNKNISTGFFAFDKPGPDRLLSTWFLYSDSNNYIIQKWKEKIIYYWNNNNKIKHYFRHHYIFGDLYKSNIKFKELWDSTPKISANGPHFILCQGILKKLSDKVKNHINEVKTPLYKLTYKYDMKKYNEECNLSYLMNTPMFTFVHIGKTGGSTIEKCLNDNYINYEKRHCCEIEYNQNKLYVISIRNPISRFISAFNWRYYLLKTKIQENDYELKIYEKYKNVNNLAEHLYIDNKLNKELDRDINKVYNYHPSHLGMGINYYIGKLLQKCPKDKIVKVIMNETLNDELKSFFNIEVKLKLKNNSSFGDKQLSNTGFINLKRYLEKDYKCIQKLIDFNLVNKDYIIHTDKKIRGLNLKFIHIGKCAGTSIIKQINLEQYHLQRNYKNNENYIIWIRNPLKRFVSAFNYSYSIINTDTSNLDINNLTLDNCLAPNRTRYKMTHDHTYSKRYDYLVNYFKTANELAESITSENIEKKQLALELMNSPLEHIFNGIGWYLHNGNFIEKNYNKIMFVGTCENLADDMTKLSNLLNINLDNKKHLRKNTNNNDKFLSPKAIKNILNFYKDTDYKALQKLVEYNFITKDLFEKYHHYSI